MIDPIDGFGSMGLREMASTVKLCFIP